MPATEEEVKGTEQLLRLLEKTHKTLRLYQVDNEVCRRRVDELHAALAQHLARFGSCDLEVAEQSISLDRQTVYDAGERSDSLAFLLFRDGIRQLSVIEGVERGELQDLLAALGRVSVVANEEDDLVTLFWEADFRHIRCSAVEELPNVPEGPRLTEKLASGTLKPRADGAQRVDLRDIDRPVSRLPAAECLLADHELAELQAELEAEQSEDDLEVVAELAAELTLLEPEDGERALIREELAQVVDRVVDSQPLPRVAAMVDRLDELAGGELSDQTSIRALLEALIEHQARADRIERILERVEAAPEPPPDTALTAYLTRLSLAAVPTLLAWVERLTDPRNRRAVANAILAAGPRGAEAILCHLRSTPALGPLLLHEALYVARRLGGPAGLPLLRGLLELEDPPTRRQAALALGPYQEGPVGATWVELLRDRDGEIRMLAMTALLRGGQPELAQPIAELTMTEEFTESPLEEKMRAFAAIARLGGEQGLGWFADILGRPHPRWFASRSAREMITAAAHALTQLRSSRARELLEELAASHDRVVRAACREAIKGIEHGR